MQTDSSPRTNISCTLSDLPRQASGILFGTDGGAYENIIFRILGLGFLTAGTINWTQEVSDCLAISRLCSPTDTHKLEQLSIQR